MRNFINYIREKVGIIANVLGIVSIVFGAAIAMIPDFRIFVERNITGVNAWYYVGVIKPKENRWAVYPENSEREFKNYYHLSWETWKNGRRNIIDQDTINKAINTIVIHTASHSVTGRDNENESQRDKKTSNNRIIANSNPSDCLYANKFKFVDGNGTVVEKDTDVESVNIWMNATKITCY